MSARIALPAISAAALLLAGCGATIDGKPQAAPGAQVSTTSKPPSNTTSAKPSGKPGATTTRPDKGGDTDFQASIGDCVKLGGTSDDATIAKATCGSQSSNYKVIGKAKTNAQCPTDADQAYYETLAGVETGAICLDIDWVVNDCLDLGGDDPKRIPCTSTTATEGVKVLSIIKGTTDVEDCSSGDKGYIYDERQFVVCVKVL
ncbi:LppU family putative lipoprotein [Nocardia jejuensis]|uniref:LppU family putative lipoprotein n=1 Tax=Nocardia jejuensis TaxID=328049 RepID=UPI000835CFD1